MPYRIMRLKFLPQTQREERHDPQQREAAALPMPDPIRLAEAPAWCAVLGVMQWYQLPDADDPACGADA